MPIAVLQRFNQELVGPRDSTAFGLDLDHRGKPLKLGFPFGCGVRHSVPGQTEPVREFRAERHSPSHPCGRPCRGRFGTSHLGHQPLKGHQRHGMPRKHKGIPFFQRGHKRLFHMTEQPLTFEVHSDHRSADNGPHAHSVSPCFGAVAHDPSPILVHVHPSVLGVRAKRGTARGDDVEALAPVVVFHVLKGMGAQQHVTHLVGFKTIPHGQCAQPLDEHVPAENDGCFGLDFPVGNGLTQRHRLHEFESMGGHEMGLARLARTMSATSRPLNHAGHALGSADLDHRIHRAKIHPQIEGGGAHHRPETAVVQGVFHPLPELT